MKSCRGASSDSDHFLVKERYRCKIAYSKYEPNRTTRRLHVGALREASNVRRFQQQLEEEFGKLETERVMGEKSHVQEDWKKLKEVIMEAAEQTIGYQPKSDRRGWFDNECRKALEEKNATYKKWINRPTRAKRMECGRLRKVAYKMCRKRKRTQMDNRMRDIEENIKDKQIRNAYKEGGSLRASFQPHTDLCRGTNYEILLKQEETKTRWKTYFQDLLNPPPPPPSNDRSSYLYKPCRH